MSYNYKYEGEEYIGIIGFILILSFVLIGAVALFSPDEEEITLEQECSKYRDVVNINHIPIKCQRYWLKK